MEIRSTPLLNGSVGTSRELISFHFGAPGKQKIYIQAALHADETPTMLVALHLKRRLIALEAQGAINAEIVVVPVANPIGLDQTVLGQFIGRFDLETGQNFNRNFPALDLSRASGRLGADPQENLRIVRSAVREELAELKANSELDSLQVHLLQLSVDADLVLDLHCSLEACMHLYANAEQWAQVEPLSRYIGAEASLLATDSGGASFDETHSLFWWRLRQSAGSAAGATPIADGCVAVTIECRGQRDVSDELARRDAEAIIDYLTWRGAITGEPKPLPPLLAPATPLNGSEQFVAPVGGVLVHRAQVGARIEQGDAVFDIVDPLTDRTTTIHSHTCGVFYMRRAIRFVRAGQPIGRVSGSVPIRTGKLIGL
ncbi:MAG: succinylglutamate desuccinylase/aspartoacylase family protein [Paucibacter sp.]|nr:succinylglutamate desuccinylase/aspartoacylase family protein [Roseateles sp.]